MSSSFGLRSSYILEYHWLFALILRSARCFTGVEGKWTLLPHISPPSSKFKIKELLAKPILLLLLLNLRYSYWSGAAAEKLRFFKHSLCTRFSTLYRLCYLTHKSSARCISFFFHFIFLKILLIFLERGKGKERISIGCLLHTPNQGSGLQPRHVPWPGFELVIFWFQGQCSTHWATPSRDPF